jgi:hypothetical protein
MEQAAWTAHAEAGLTARAVAAELQVPEHVALDLIDRGTRLTSVLGQQPVAVHRAARRMWD